MRFFKLTLDYDGTDFCGWQVQAAGRTVQAVVEQAWHAVTGENVRVVASGRTDAGVHALGQIASCCSQTSLAAKILQRALNAKLPADVRAVDVTEMPHDFHAIRNAIAKRYRYVIHNGCYHDVFQRRYSWFVSRPLDVAAIRRAARHLVGTHDFASFQAAGSPRKTTVRTLHELTVRCRRSGTDRRITFEIEADGFLYNMVRNLVGTLCIVGLGKQPPRWVAEVLAARDRRKAGPTAPPQGLSLLSVTLSPLSPTAASTTEGSRNPPQA